MIDKRLPQQILPLFVCANASLVKVVRVSRIRHDCIRLRGGVLHWGDLLRAELREHQRARRTTDHQVAVIPRRVVAQVGGEERLDKGEFAGPQRVRLHSPLPARIKLDIRRASISTVYRSYCSETGDGREEGKGVR